MLSSVSVGEGLKTRATPQSDAPKTPNCAKKDARDASAAVEALEAIKTHGAEFCAKVEHVDCDLASFDSVKKAIAKVKKNIVEVKELMSLNDFKDQLKIYKV